jgi:hypothetical protein
MAKNDEFIDEYIETLLDEQGFDNDLSKDIRESMKKDLEDRLNNYFISKSLENLKEEDIKEVNKIIDKGGETSEVWDFISKNIPDFNSFSVNLLKEFREIYLGRA